MTHRKYMVRKRLKIGGKIPEAKNLKRHTPDISHRNSDTRNIKKIPEASIEKKWGNHNKRH